MVEFITMHHAIVLLHVLIIIIFSFLELVQADRAILRKLYELYSERHCWHALQYALRIPLHSCRFLPGHPPNIGLQVRERWSCSACEMSHLIVVHP